MAWWITTRETSSAIGSFVMYPPLGVEVISEFQEFQESFKSLKLHKVFSKDEDGSRKSKDGKCSIVVHLFCFELNLLMLNRFCSSNV
jgi:hypothetical protein